MVISFNLPSVPFTYTDAAVVVVGALVNERLLAKRVCALVVAVKMAVPAELERVVVVAS